MKKNCLLAFAIAGVLVGCSEDELVSENVSNLTREIPIEFSVQKENITRASSSTQKLEDLGHYNFGVWAYKVQNKNSLNDALVMDNYLVGYSNETDKKGYDHSNATTWAGEAGNVDDHKSPWFYEGLGTSEYNYSGTDGYYTTSSTNYLSNNVRQILRYWDLAYAKTNFYAYAPYNKDVKFAHAAGTSTMTFDPTIIRDGYDEPLNATYNDFDRSLTEYMYAGVQATNADKQDVVVPFKHMGAQLFIRFYEDIKDYRVEIIDLDADNGILATGVTKGYATQGIQVAPAKKNTTDSYEKAKYYTTQGATVTFKESDASASYEAKWDGSTQDGTPLMFQIPAAGKKTSADAPDNLTDLYGYKVIPELETSVVNQKYSYSPTIYYPVAQPTTSETGFTLHVSYRIIAETDDHEVITVHNATVFIPAKDNNGEFIAAWQPGMKYTYTFKITKNSTGTTNPDTPIDPTDETTSTTKGLYPIVFDGATIEDYTEVKNETTHNDGDTDY